MRDEHKDQDQHESAGLCLDHFYNFQRVRSSTDLVLVSLSGQSQPRSFSNVQLFVVFLSSACIPSEISKLKKLETLSLNGNRIQQLPPTLGQLKALRTLNLSGNQFSEFPSGLGTLRHLDLLDLSRNQIQNVPAEVSELQAIEINLNQNQVPLVSQSLSEHCETPEPQTVCMMLLHTPSLSSSHSRSLSCRRRWPRVPV